MPSRPQQLSHLFSVRQAGRYASKEPSQFGTPYNCVAQVRHTGHARHDAGAVELVEWIACLIKEGPMVR